MRKDLAHNYKSTMSEISKHRSNLKKILSNLMKPRFTLDLFLQVCLNSAREINYSYFQSISDEHAGGHFALFGGLLILHIG